MNPNKNAVKNVQKAHRTASRGRAVEELSHFMSSDEMNMPVKELTPGKRRIVEIVHAMFVPADFLVFDEPFEGMNDEEKEAAVSYILRMRGTRPLLIASRSIPEIPDIRVTRMG